MERGAEVDLHSLIFLGKALIDDMISWALHSLHFSVKYSI